MSAGVLVLFSKLFEVSTNSTLKLRGPWRPPTSFSWLTSERAKMTHSAKQTRETISHNDPIVPLKQRFGTRTMRRARVWCLLNVMGVWYKEQFWGLGGNKKGTPLIMAPLIAPLRGGSRLVACHCHRRCVRPRTANEKPNSKQGSVVTECRRNEMNG